MRGRNSFDKRIYFSNNESKFFHFLLENIQISFFLFGSIKLLNNKILWVKFEALVQLQFDCNCNWSLNSQTKMEKEYVSISLLKNDNDFKNLPPKSPISSKSGSCGFF